jgi:hypothetical protein
MVTSEKDGKIYEKAITWVKQRGYSKVKVNLEDEEVEKPTSFKQPSSSPDEEEYYITPDITAVMRGNKCYFEIAMKSENKQDLITKWKLLDRLASIKEGKFFLFTPHGHRAFADRLIKQHDINATLINI